MSAHNGRSLPPELIAVLRRALLAEAERFEPGSDGLERIEARIAASRRSTGAHRRLGRWWPAVAGAVRRLRPIPESGWVGWLRPAAAVATGLLVVFAVSFAVNGLPQAISPANNAASISRPQSPSLTSAPPTTPQTSNSGASGYYGPGSSGSPSSTCTPSRYAKQSPDSSPSASGSASPSRSGSPSTSPSSSPSQAVSNLPASPSPGTVTAAGAWSATADWVTDLPGLLNAAHLRHLLQTNAPLAASPTPSGSTHPSFSPSVSSPASANPCGSGQAAG